MNLTNDVALVTGSGRGIGRQIAIDLAEAGAAVGLLARSEHQIREVAARIEGSGGRAIFIAGDVTDRRAVESAVQFIEQQFGPITIAVNNAGIDRPFGPVELVDPEEWWYAQAVHVLGPYNVMHAVIPHMRTICRGRIINVISAASNVVGPNTSAYCVAKATLLRLTEHVDMEIKDAGLSAFAVDPGTVMTDMAKNAIADPTVRKWAKGMVEHLEKYRDVDPAPALQQLGRQVTALASGHFDGLSGRYLNLDLNLDEQLAAAQRGHS